MLKDKEIGKVLSFTGDEVIALKDLGFVGPFNLTGALLGSLEGPKTKFLWQGYNDSYRTLYSTRSIQADVFLHPEIRINRASLLDLLHKYTDVQDIEVVYPTAADLSELFLARFRREERQIFEKRYFQASDWIGGFFTVTVGLFNKGEVSIRLNRPNQPEQSEIGAELCMVVSHSVIIDPANNSPD